MGTKLQLSTAHHTQTDGQTEIYNQYLDKVLRPYVNYYQDDWPKYLPAVDFGYASHPHESTGLAPFMVEHGYMPRTSFDWRRPDPSKPMSVRERMTRDEAVKFAKRLEEVTKFAQDHLRKAQAAMQVHANKHRREVEFDVGDYVYVTTKHWRTERPSKKLDYQNAGRYRIIEKIGHSFKLDLPSSIKVKPVFHAEKLRKAAMDPLPGQDDDSTLPIVVNEQQEWEVEEILASKLRYHKLYYRVKWKGWAEPDLEWYPAVNFTGAPHKLRDFHKAYPNEPGPPRYLPEWITSFENGDDQPPPETIDGCV